MDLSLELALLLANLFHYMVMVVQIFVSTFMYLCTFASHKPESSLQPHGLMSCEVKSNTGTGSGGKLIDKKLLKNVIYI